MIGGACVRARIEANEISIPGFSPDLGIPGLPSSSLVVPGSNGIPCLGCGVPRINAPRVVSTVVTHSYLRSPIAWRTAPYWASVLDSVRMKLLWEDLPPRVSLPRRIEALQRRSALTTD